MLVEDIPIFLSFEDFKENGIKTIQTLGELIHKSETYATLLSLTTGNNSEFPISFKSLNVNDIYIKDSQDRCCAIWKKYLVFKIYGTLKVEKSKDVLEASHLVPVHDVVGTWNVMMLLIATARSEFRQYYRTKAQNNILQSQWINMKEQEKRLVKIDTL
ncbi:hypothetical protein WN48_06888 [Eufriesea mexicana]|uniref:Uncharacterized protein n=1 Tax=Eufriesea mexicana TaxID=516756 RepID=A0A310SV43_9HYME|nr:hypothetical protein WN48_06888 [Eufriesea mexicana]